jgi:hypothetical protein
MNNFETFILDLDPQELGEMCFCTSNPNWNGIGQERSKNAFVQKQFVRSAKMRLSTN